jgi:hypothetical protein
LQIARQSSHTGPAEIETLRQKTDQWFTDYQGKIKQLVETALATEQTPI